jgi:hypothetical protein
VIYILVLNAFFILTDEKQEFFELAIHENHEEGCPGDPSTAPIWERFQIMKTTAVVI